jgi:hypothetical protein
MSILGSLEDILDNISSTVRGKLERAREKLKPGNFFGKVSGMVTCGCFCP